MRLSAQKKSFTVFYLFNLILLLAASSCAGNASNLGSGGGAASDASNPSTGSNSPNAPAADPTAGVAGGGSNGAPPSMVNGRLEGNPFVGASMYINPDYAKQVQATAGASTSDQVLLAKASSFPTAVWLDRTRAIAGGAANGNRLSLIGHLDAAVAQASKSTQPVVVTFVVYNLPGRDCAAAASAGELPGTAAGLASYKTSFIDPIAAALASKPAYQKLRIALIIEPDSLPNMVTNISGPTSIPTCVAVAANNLYTDGVTYAIQKFSAMPNTSLYLDIGHSGWLGWANNMAKAATLYTNLINTATANHPALVRGLADDIANYTPLKEPFVSPSNTTLLDGTFYQNNPVFDEQTFVSNLTAAFKTAGFTGTLGFITDTSRSGWAPINDGHPIDRRKARGNWCNVGSGIGPRPQAAPAGTAGVDAYLFVKPPGESDGGSTAGAPGYDPNCAPASPTNALNGMPDAPAAGQWFDSGFLTLLHSATPALR
jgi:cellulose 1,4-beta-cellobiosidase